MSLTNHTIGAIVLAAGKGTRMHSQKPKVLHEILGESMLRLVYNALDAVINGDTWTVVGHGASQVCEAFACEDRQFILQEQQLGTGHALQCAWDAVTVSGMEYVLVVNGDTPLLRQNMLSRFIQETTALEADVGFMTLILPTPGAFGRVVRHNRRVAAVVEAKDYDSTLYGPEPNEVNAGIYLFRVAAISTLLPLLVNNNASAEYYITDIISLAVERGLTVHGMACGNDSTLLGVNSPAELCRSEALLRGRLVLQLLESGVHIHAPESVRIGPGVLVMPGAVIHGPCEIYGQSVIEAEAVVHSHCWIKDSYLHGGSQVRNFSHLEGATLHSGVVAGPYARLRSGAVLHQNAKVGNFVEIKNSVLHEGAKASHLSYLGDAEVGSAANIGAGTITCNYDGTRKHRTVIGENAFVGSNSALVAPVAIGDSALVGAGSVITKDVPDNGLGITRPPQKNLPRKRQP